MRLTPLINQPQNEEGEPKGKCTFFGDSKLRNTVYKEYNDKELGLYSGNYFLMHRS